MKNRRSDTSRINVNKRNPRPRPTNTLEDWDNIINKTKRNTKAMIKLAKQYRVLVIVESQDQDQIREPAGTFEIAVDCGRNQAVAIAKKVADLDLVAEVVQSVQ